jgi:hypothetical protein
MYNIPASALFPLSVRHAPFYCAISPKCAATNKKYMKSKVETEINFQHIRNVLLTMLDIYVRDSAPEYEQFLGEVLVG